MPVNRHRISVNQPCANRCLEEGKVVAQHECRVRGIAELEAGKTGRCTRDTPGAFD
jgi:hypothetical protein